MASNLLILYHKFLPNLSLKWEDSYLFMRNPAILISNIIKESLARKENLKIKKRILYRFLIFSWLFKNNQTSKAYIFLGLLYKKEKWFKKGIRGIRFFSKVSCNDRFFREIEDICDIINVIKSYKRIYPPFWKIEIEKRISIIEKMTYESGEIPFLKDQKIWQEIKEYCTGLDLKAARSFEKIPYLKYSFNSADLYLDTDKTFRWEFFWKGKKTIDCDGVEINGIKPNLKFYKCPMIKKMWINRKKIFLENSIFSDEEITIDYKFAGKGIFCTLIKFRVSPYWAVSFDGNNFIIEKGHDRLMLECTGGLVKQCKLEEESIIELLWEGPFPTFLTVIIQKIQ